MRSTDEISSESRYGHVLCEVTVEGDDVSQEDADNARREGTAKALHALGHIGEKLYTAASRSSSGDNVPVSATQSADLGGAKITVTVTAHYPEVSPYLASMAIADVPGQIAASIISRALGMSKKDVLSELASVFGDDDMLAMLENVDEEGGDGFPMMPGMPGLMRRPQSNSSDGESHLGQYL